MAVSSNKERLINFYSRFIKNINPNSRGEVSFKAFCHDDSHESASVNLDTGMWYCQKCFIGGDEYTYFQKFQEMVNGKKYNWSETKATVDALAGGPRLEEDKPNRKSENSNNNVSNEESTLVDRKVIPMGKVERWHELLLKTPHILKYITEKRGVSLKTVKKHKIGWDTERITLPIFDVDGECINIRRYDMDAKGIQKMLSYEKGLGSARLHPISRLKESEVIILNEGEWDMYLGDELGLPTMCVTGGAGSWKTNWNELFRGKTVYICYDIDDSGKTGAEKVAREISSYAQTVYIVKLPLTEPKNADFTDYIIWHGHGIDDFKELMAKTPPYARAKEEIPIDDEVYDVTLNEAASSAYFNKRTNMDVIVAGKDLAPFIIPKRVVFNCYPDYKICSQCKIASDCGRAEIDILPDSYNILKLVKLTDERKEQLLKEIAGIPTTCRHVEITEVEAQNVEKVSIIPDIDASTLEKDSEFVRRTAYIVGQKVLANQAYNVEGITFPDPWRQQATHLLYKTTPAKSDIDNFVLTPELAEGLKVFQLEEGQSIKNKLDEIYQDFEGNVTKIYGRRDLLFGIDLVYHSVLAFKFQNKLIEKGWLEALVLGDTRTGKSETAHQLLKFYNLGEFVTCENTTFAGLVGGLSPTGADKGWQITWGKIPLNNKKLVVLDEVSGLSVDSIELLSGIRSSGIAEITKIQTEKTYSKTRLIWISNDRAGTGLSQYEYGCRAVSALIGKNEDIARFDFVVTAATNEVPTSVINSLVSQEEIEHKYKAELCRGLVLWAWSRKPQDVTFTESAIKSILKYAEKMGQIYTSDVPIVEAANQRIKIARMAIALAARLFSTDETSTKLIVKEEHVKHVYLYLNEIYSKVSLGYLQLSDDINHQAEKAEMSREEVFKQISRAPELVDVLLSTRIIRPRSLEYAMGWESDEVKNFTKFLASRGMLKDDLKGFRKTPALIKILREYKSIQSKKKLEEKLD